MVLNKLKWREITLKEYSSDIQTNELQFFVASIKQKC